MWKPGPSILHCSQRKSAAAYLKLLNLSAGNILTAHCERMYQQAVVCLFFFSSLLLFIPMLPCSKEGPLSGLDIRRQYNG